MNEEKLDLSVIIVSWNVGELLVEALRSLESGLRDLRAEVIVVDNGSVDGSVGLVRREFPYVTIIANRENIGFTRANNLAMKQSKGRYVLLLNPDTVVFADTVKRLVGFMDRTPDAGIAGCKQVYANGEWQSTCHRTITLRHEAVVALGLSVFPQLVDYGDLPLKATDPFRVDWVGGACLIIRRDLAERVSFLDENLPMYAEDADLCQRVRGLGYFVYYLPDVSVIHHRGQSALKSSESPTIYDCPMLLQRFVGRRYVIRKSYGKLHANAYLVLIVIRMLRKLVQVFLQSLFPHPQRPGAVLAARRKEYLRVLKAALRGRI